MYPSYLCIHEGRVNRNFAVLNVDQAKINTQKTYRFCKDIFYMIIGIYYNTNVCCKTVNITVKFITIFDRFELFFLVGCQIILGGECITKN